MRKYQYDDSYFIISENNEILSFQDYEEEEAYARVLNYGRR